MGVTKEGKETSTVSNTESDCAIVCARARKRENDGDRIGDILAFVTTAEGCVRSARRKASKVRTLEARGRNKIIKRKEKEERKR